MAKVKPAAQPTPGSDNFFSSDNLDAASTWDLSGAEIDRLLATDNDARLKQLFGDDYEPLRGLALQAQQRVRALGRKVLIVPGILGSTLGLPGNFITRHTIWFDPTALAKGDASLLRLDANNRCEALGVVPIAHTYLRLRLRMHGFEVDYFPYDWRTSIVEAGKKLAAHLKATSPTYVVAHSMGGLVARAALKFGGKDLTRVVMIGTPNQGSFSPVQVLQGINSTVTLIDRLDSQHTADELVKKVFSTFPSLYEMLPRPAVFSDLDLFDSTKWPQNNFVPEPQRLQSVSAAWKKFVDKDPRLALIVGSKQCTVTTITKGDSSGFAYHSTCNGDGTVPLVMCELSDVPTWYHPATHTGLLRSEAVARGVVDLLLTGKTGQLSAQRPALTRSGGRTLHHVDYLDDPQHPRLLEGRRARAIQPQEHALIAEAVMAMSSMPAEETLNILRQDRITQSAEKSSLGAGALLAPSTQTADAGRLTAGLRLQNTTIAQDQHDQLELELFHGNLFDVPYRAITMGIFSNVDPVGPAQTADILTFGAVTELRTRRMFDASVGKIFVMPTGRNLMKADYIVFAGLGEYNEFALNSESILRTVSCNILRTLMNCGVDEFATLLFGGTTNLTIRRSVESFIQGYMDALEALGDNPQSIHFRRIALCEMSPERYGELKDEAYRLGATSMCSEIRLTLHEARYPETAAALSDTLSHNFASPAHRTRLGKNIIYLNVGLERLREDSLELETDQWAVHASLLGAGSRAIIYSSVQRFSRTQLDALLAQVPDANLAMQHQLGTQIRDLVLTPDFVKVLDQDVSADDHLSVIVEPEATRIPWEILPLFSPQSPSASQSTSLPCMRGGLSRRFRADGQAIAKFLEIRQREPVLRVLLIVDPTGDLMGAKKEGLELASLINGLTSATAEVLLNDEATRERILQEMGSGTYDVVHYAGHAYFDPNDRSRSGLVCAGFTQLKRQAILTGHDLQGLTRLPALVFFNACESGRVRKLAIPDGTINELNRATRKQNATSGDRSRQDAGVCEAMLRGGISQFIGTYWPVEDSSATQFASHFYQAMVKGQTMLECMQAGRQALQGLGSQDLSNYIHYGDPDFVIKASPSDSV